jgi:hypothetical protein
MGVEPSKRRLRSREVGVPLRRLVDVISRHVE